jgi:hypothetical protein
MHFDPYASGVLVKEHHERLVADLPRFARDAGIQPRWVATPLADACGPTEIDYVKKFNIHRAGGTLQGLCYVRATPAADPALRMSAIAGALVRNFIRARVMMLGAVLDLLAAREEIKATALLIPNFHLSRDEGGGIAKWQTQALHDLLLERGQEDLQTVLYATSLADLGQDYGTAFRSLIEAHYLTVEI